MDSREVKFCGVVMDVHVRLTAHPNISIRMDIVVIDLPEYRGCSYLESLEQTLEVFYKWIFLMQFFPLRKMPTSIFKEK